ncbi:MAG: arginine N-succinyltransferase, partial [Moraxella sp.]
MFIVRHASVNDLDDIFVLAEKSGIGMTTLPANKKVLLSRLKRIEK